MTDFKKLLKPDIQDFIIAYANDDVRGLALKKCPNPDWPYPIILDQIKTRQKAKLKAPQLLNNQFLFPSSGIFEQASSTATALFKASLFNGKSFTDLTAGAGIDAWAFLQKAQTATLIDANEDNAALLAHNFDCETHHTTAEDFIATMPQTDFVLIDPQRRNEKRKGLYHFEDCSPDITQILPHINANTILIKASPMIDLDYGVQILQETVQETLQNISDIYCAEWKGECKEVLFSLKPNDQSQSPTPTIHAINIDDNGKAINHLKFTQNDEKQATINITAPQKYLYEPGSAFLKSGGYKTIAHQYGLSKLHQHSHLYTSEDKINNFPGRSFEILNILPPNTKNFPLPKANITTRNFPQKPEILRKKLKIKDGGDDYLFATTANTGKHILIHAKKTS